jgi:hypothetical protein
MHFLVDRSVADLLLESAGFFFSFGLVLLDVMKIDHLSQNPAQVAFDRTFKSGSGIPKGPGRTMKPVPFKVFPGEP